MIMIHGLSKDFKMNLIELMYEFNISLMGNNKGKISSLENSLPEQLKNE